MEQRIVKYVLIAVCLTDYYFDESFLNCNHSVIHNFCREVNEKAVNYKIENLVNV